MLPLKSSSKSISKSKASSSSTSSNDETDFDNECILTFDKTYRDFIHADKMDTFEGMTRSEYRCKYSNLYSKNKDLSLQKLSILKNKPKSVPENNLSSSIPDPFEILGFSEKTDIQQKIEKHSGWMNTYGNYAYSCSCGAGKTVAGIYVMFKKQCKTLIISSRNAVNDQWKQVIEQVYPNLIVATKDGNFQNGIKLKDKTILPDVYIYSPQYLVNKIDTINIYPSLIIYDEVHSLLSKEFIKVLLFPFHNVIVQKWPEIPYMIALSATYPSNSTWQGKEANIRINKIFGSVFKSSSSVTKIPVMVWDYRDHYERTNREGIRLKGEEARNNFDSGYKPMTDNEAIQYFCEKIRDENKIQICPEFKGIVMTYSIDSSVYAALFVHAFWNCNVVLVRAANEYCLLLEKDKYLDYEFDESTTLKTLENDKIGLKCEYKYVVDKCSIIVGTLQRLKEGFSVQNIVWGICTKFVYNTIPRVQILGRIRRSSDDPILNNHERIFYVMSGSVPTTIGIPNYRGKHKVLYNFEIEEMLFKMENYVRV